MEETLLLPGETDILRKRTKGEINLRKEGLIGSETEKRF